MKPMSSVRWHIVGLLMALCFISHFNRASMAVAGSDRIMDQYQLSPVQMGTVYSAFLLIYSLCMIPGGVLIDRIGPRRALLLVALGSGVLGALTGVLGWLIPSGAAILTGLICVRGTMGFLSAPLHPAGARAVGNWFPPGHRSWANGIVTAAAIAGVAASYPGFGGLIRGLGWQMAFVACGVATVGLGFLWGVLARDWPSQHPGVNAEERDWIGAEPGPSSAPTGASTGATWSSLLLNPSLMLVTLSYAAVGYFQYLFVYWMQYYFDKVLNVGETTSKYYAGILQVALAAGMPLGGWLSAHWGQRWGVRRGRAVVAGFGMALSALLLGVGVWSQTPGFIVLWFALAHLALGASEGPIWATAVDLGGPKGGTAAAICNTGGNLGGLLAPVVTPWISQQVGWGWGIGFGGLICFLGALCWCGIKPNPLAIRPAGRG